MLLAARRAIRAQNLRSPVEMRSQRGTTDDSCSWRPAAPWYRKLKKLVGRGLLRSRSHATRRMVRADVSVLLLVVGTFGCHQARERPSTPNGRTVPEARTIRRTPWEQRAEAILRARLSADADPRVFDDRSNPLRAIDAPFCPPVSLLLPGDTARLAEIVTAVRSSTSSLHCSEVCLENKNGSDRLCSTGVLDAPAHIPR